MTVDTVPANVPPLVLVTLMEHLDAEASTGHQGMVSSGIVRGILDPAHASVADRLLAIETLTECEEVMAHDESPYAQLIGEFRDILADYETDAPDCPRRL